MKLFKRARNAIPAQTRPDYDAIDRMEKEFRLDDSGFDERMDEAIIECFAYPEVHFRDMDIDELGEFIDKLYDLVSQLSSIKYKNEVLDRIERMETRRFELSRRNWDRRHYDLRSKMVERGKNRKN